MFIPIWNPETRKFECADFDGAGETIAVTSRIVLQNGHKSVVREVMPNGKFRYRALTDGEP